MTTRHIGVHRRKKRSNGTPSVDSLKYKVPSREKGLKGAKLLIEVAQKRHSESDVKGKKSAQLR